MRLPEDAWMRRKILRLLVYKNVDGVRVNKITKSQSDFHSQAGFVDEEGMFAEYTMHNFTDTTDDLHATAMTEDASHTIISTTSIA
jgi:hypothetical protein